MQLIWVGIGTPNFITISQIVIHIFNKFALIWWSEKIIDLIKRLQSGVLQKSSSLTAPSMRANFNLLSTCQFAVCVSFRKQKLDIGKKHLVWVPFPEQIRTCTHFLSFLAFRHLYLSAHQSIVSGATQWAGHTCRRNQDTQLKSVAKKSLKSCDLYDRLIIIVILWGIPWSTTRVCYQISLSFAPKGALYLTPPRYVPSHPNLNPPDE